jgi:hypothetical protein
MKDHEIIHLGNGWFQVQTLHNGAPLTSVFVLKFTARQRSRSRAWQRGRREYMIVRVYWPETTQEEFLTDGDEIRGYTKPIPFFKVYKTYRGEKGLRLSSGIINDAIRAVQQGAIEGTIPEATDSDEFLQKAMAPWFNKSWLSV